MKALILLALIASPVAAQLPAERTLAQIDRTFICPEYLPDDDARMISTELFTRQVMSMGPITARELAGYRMKMLRKHGCAKTLANIAAAVRK